MALDSFNFTGNKTIQNLPDPSNFTTLHVAQFSEGTIAYAFNQLYLHFYNETETELYNATVELLLNETLPMEQKFTQLLRMHEAKIRQEINVTFWG